MWSAVKKEALFHANSSMVIGHGCENSTAMELLAMRLPLGQVALRPGPSSARQLRSVMVHSALPLSVLVYPRSVHSTHSGLFHSDEMSSVFQLQPGKGSLQWKVHSPSVMAAGLHRQVPTPGP